MNIVREWFRRHFANQQLVVLLLILLACFATVVVFGRLLLPVLISMAIAYLLDGVVIFLGRLGLPRLLRVIFVYSGFLAAFVGGILILVPLLTEQIRGLAGDVGRLDLEELVDRIPVELFEVFAEPIAEGDGATDPNGQTGPNGPATPNDSGTPDGIGAPDGTGTPNDTGTPNGSGTPNASGADSSPDRPAVDDFAPSGDGPIETGRPTNGETTSAETASTAAVANSEESEDLTATELLDELSEEEVAAKRERDEAARAAAAEAARARLKTKLREIPKDAGNRLLGEFDNIVTGVLEQIPLLIQLLVYAILIPTLVFFMLKDKHSIQRWFQNFLPTDRTLATQVWHDLDLQIGNYIRGKVWEILIIGGASYLTFAVFDLNLALLLGISVGLSVIVPYIGATVVTLPVAIVAYAQFGFSPMFAWLMVAYLVIQILDGNVLVPLLFSEVVSLHPIAIIAAILVFGGIWGFWGVFFAIPLATLVQAVIKAWPRAGSDELAPKATG